MTNTPPPPAPKPKGARPGHPGAGRQAFDARQAARVIAIPPVGGDRCPTCDTLLEDKGTDSRAVIESHPVKAERVLYGGFFAYPPEKVYFRIIQPGFVGLRLALIPE
jgi:hypothetical protein